MTNQEAIAKIWHEIVSIRECVGMGEQVEALNMAIEALKAESDDNICKKCKKDWTKCGKCPVMMEWVKEIKVEGMK